MPPPSIVIEDLSKTFGRQTALDGVGLNVERGETLALLGHNGAGKTTMMKIMLGLLRPSAGRVRVLGRDPVQRNAIRARREIGFLPENVSFAPALTGREILKFYARLKRAPAADCDRLLDRVGLHDAADRRVGGYSKGMRQRLGLAQALLGEPHLLLLDEPTTGLDPALRARFYDIIAELTGRGVTVILSSHALSELEDWAQRVAIMCRARLVADGTLESLRRASHLPVRLQLITRQTAPALAETLGRPVIALDDTKREITCGFDDKMALLRRIAALGPVIEDIEILPPSLDEVYAFFSQRDDP